jgi:hypothetical protein
MRIIKEFLDVLYSLLQVFLFFAAFSVFPLFIILFIVTFFVVYSTVFQHYQKDFQKVAVTGKKIPELFPVLVITPGPRSEEYHAKKLYYRDLDDYLAEHKEYSFLMPEGQDEWLNEELSRKSGVSTGPPQVHFSVERLSDGRQYLEVYHTWGRDRDNNSWYEATAKEIVPKYHQVYHWLSIFDKAHPVSLFITCALWIAFFIAFKLVWKKIKRRSPTQVEGGSCGKSIRVKPSRRVA